MNKLNLPKTFWINFFFPQKNKTAETQTTTTETIQKACLYLSGSSIGVQCMYSLSLMPGEVRSSNPGFGVCIVFPSCLKKTNETVAHNNGQHFPWLHCILSEFPLFELRRIGSVLITPTVGVLSLWSDQPNGLISWHILTSNHFKGIEGSFKFMHPLFRQRESTWLLIRRCRSFMWTNRLCGSLWV